MSAVIRARWISKGLGSDPYLSEKQRAGPVKLRGFFRMNLNSEIGKCDPPKHVFPEGSLVCYCGHMRKKILK